MKKNLNCSAKNFSKSLDVNRREDAEMAVLATPNKNSYVVKKENVSKFVSSKADHARMEDIKKNVQLFAKNNLRSTQK